MIKRCLFCGCDTTNCKSVEHIIPESLGNEDLILPKGVVCDKCNNYFSSEIENKVLSIQSFRDLCFYNVIPSKKGKIKGTTFLFCGEECNVDWGFANGEPALFLGASPETIKKMIKEKPERMIARAVNLDDPNHSYEISRFIYKIAIEYYAYMLIQLEENKDAECFQFDDGINRIVSFVRKGNITKSYFAYETEVEEQIIPLRPNNSRFFSLQFFEKDENLFFAVNLFGTKFTVNLSDPVVCK